MRLNTGSVAVLFAFIHGLAAITAAGFDQEYDFHVNHIQLDGITRTVVNGRSSSPYLSFILPTNVHVVYQANTQVRGLSLVEHRGNGA